jgi:hypothetical protein
MEQPLVLVQLQEELLMLYHIGGLGRNIIRKIKNVANEWNNHIIYLE